MSASTPLALRLHGPKQKNVAAELLEKLLKDERAEFGMSNWLNFEIRTSSFALPPGQVIDVFTADGFERPQARLDFGRCFALMAAADEITAESSSANHLAPGH